jgi:hypothetical protein
MAPTAASVDAATERRLDAASLAAHSGSMLVSA